MFPNADGYALGSIEGRVAIQYVFYLLLFHFSPWDNPWDCVSPSLTFCGLRRVTRNLDDKDQE